MKFNKDEFWDTNYYDNPPLTMSMIELAEKELRVRLPELFISFLHIQNGGYTQGFAYLMNQKTAWAEDHVPLNEMFGIVTEKSFESGHNILQSPYLTKEWGLPENQVAISGDGHWFITLDYRKGEKPSVRWIDVECNEDIHVADNFESFIDKLITYDEYEQKQIV